MEASRLLRAAHVLRATLVAASVWTARAVLSRATAAVQAHGTASGACHPNASAIDRARALRPPSPRAVRNGEYEAAEFWDANEELIAAAWQELGVADRTLAAWTDMYVDERLRVALRGAWRDATAAAEASVTELWTEVCPGVFTAPLLTVEGVRALRGELARVEASGVPIRRPNGMNRYGTILTQEGLALRPWVEGLVARVVRPLAMALFPAHLGAGDAAECYAFTVQYSAADGGDRILSEHRDASVATLNVNINLPGETYEGSGLFFPPADGVEACTVAFDPGVAVVHLGARRHAAMAILAGERTNLVVWLHGEGGYVRFAPYPAEAQLTARERWSEDVGATGRRRFHIAV